MKNGSVLLSTTSQVSTGFWVAKELLLFEVIIPTSANADELAFVNYMECTDSVKSLDKTSARLRLYRSRKDEHDYTRISQKPKKKKILGTIGESFGVEQISSNQESVGDLCADYKIQPFTNVLYWSQRRFYIN